MCKCKSEFIIYVKRIIRLSRKNYRGRKRVILSFWVVFGRIFISRYR